MYNRIAKYITNEMIRNSIIEKEKYDLYLYGFELMLAYFFYFLSLLFVAILTNTIIESIVFCTGFLVIRKSAGGYHASSYLKCQMLFIFNQIIFVVCVKLVSLSILVYILCVVLLTMFIVMWTLAPVDNENKKLTKAEYNYFKKASKVCSFIVTLISIVLFCFFQAHIYLLSLLIGVFSATISIIVGYFQQKNICN